MDDLVKLLEDAPSEFKEKARKALLPVLDEYEDWKSLGCPSPARYNLMKFARTRFFSEPHEFQKIVKRKYLFCASNFQVGQGRPSPILFNDNAIPSWVFFSLSVFLDAYSYIERAARFAAPDRQQLPFQTGNFCRSEVAKLSPFVDGEV